MSGLVGYGSSDEGEDEHPPPGSAVKHDQNSGVQEKYTPLAVADASVKSQQAANGSNVLEPTLGPMTGPAISITPGELGESPLSPYSAERAQLMDLTLPPVPVFDIPDSPPGSPDPVMEKKFEQFAQLKKQGMHFNERLANSAAIKNPNLFNKLMTSFGIEGEQYGTSLSKDVWDPDQFPEWASKDGLAKAQTIAQKKRKETQRETGRVEFAAATRQDER